MTSRHTQSNATRSASSAGDDYTVRVLNAADGGEENLRIPISERIHNLYSLWPTFTPYIIGFALLGASFIAHTLGLEVLFGILLTLAGVVVIGTSVYRFIIRHLR